MNRQAFDSGLSHLCDSLAANFPKASVADAWYGHLSDIDGKRWMSIVQSLVRDLDGMPRNLPRAVAAYVDRRVGNFIVDATNPETGSDFTIEEAFNNRKRLEKLMVVSSDKSHPRYNRVMGCSEASAKHGESIESRRRWGSFIIKELDEEILTPFHTEIFAGWAS